jgi:hypothetical protein
MAGEIIVSGSPSFAGDPVSGNGTQINKPDPSREYVTDGDGYTYQTVPKMLPETIDDLTRFIGWSHYDAMMLHHAIISSVLTLKFGIMAGRLQLVESHPMEAGQGELRK